MARVVILSSLVCASRLGGLSQAMVLAQLGAAPIFVPTVAFGRHPGLGPPGGGALSDLMFRGLLEGVAATGVLHQARLVLTGYFASADQVAAAAELIDACRADQGERPIILVDPILGDEGKGLYVKPETAEAVRRLLVPRADLLVPNRWELAWLAQTDSADFADDLPALLSVARRLAPRTIVTSARSDAGSTSLFDISQTQATRLHHASLPKAFSGAGDLFAALLCAGLLDGLSPPEDVSRAAAMTLDVLTDAYGSGADDLALALLGRDLRRPSSQVQVEALS